MLNDVQETDISRLSQRHGLELDVVRKLLDTILLEGEDRGYESALKALGGWCRMHVERLAKAATEGTADDGADSERDFWRKWPKASRFFTPAERKLFRQIVPNWQPGCNLDRLISEARKKDPLYREPIWLDFEPGGIYANPETAVPVLQQEPRCLCYACRNGFPHGSGVEEIQAIVKRGGYIDPADPRGQ